LKIGEGFVFCPLAVHLDSHFDLISEKVADQFQPFQVFFFIPPDKDLERTECPPAYSLTDSPNLLPGQQGNGKRPGKLLSEDWSKETADGNAVTFSQSVEKGDIDGAQCGTIRDDPFLHAGLFEMEEDILHIFAFADLLAYEERGETVPDEFTDRYVGFPCDIRARCAFSVSGDAPFALKCEDYGIGLKPDQMGGRVSETEGSIIGKDVNGEDLHRHTSRGDSPASLTMSAEAPGETIGFLP